jgi:hypothetical protein
MCLLCLITERLQPIRHAVRWKEVNIPPFGSLTLSSTTVAALEVVGKEYINNDIIEYRQDILEQADVGVKEESDDKADDLLPALDVINEPADNGRNKCIR